MAGSTGVFIYGSCVTRDSFEHLDQTRFELLEYVARQSVASAFAPPGEPLLDVAELESPFQRRVLELDAASGMPGRLTERAPEIDLLLWDIFDERLGYYETGEGGVVTNTVEYLRWLREADERPPARLVPFGSREHLRSFTRSLADFAALLDATGLRDRLVLIAPSWATSTETGEPTPSSFGISARRANVLSLPYLQAIRDIVQPGLIISPPAAITTAATDHQWGVAAFHYVPEVYRRITAPIEQLTAGDSIPAALARHRGERTRRPDVVSTVGRALTRFLGR